MAAGSQARFEQTAHSDQDNFMVLDDSYVEAAHGDYFRKLQPTSSATASTPAATSIAPARRWPCTDEWRQPLARWKDYFRKWIDEPEPKALMLSCIFFDLRSVHGDKRPWAPNCHALIIEKSRQQPHLPGLHGG